jgi:hypothetical protein
MSNTVATAETRQVAHLSRGGAFSVATTPRHTLAIRLNISYRATREKQQNQAPTSSSIEPFLIDSALRLEIAAIDTKQRPAHVSNRY